MSEETPAAEAVEQEVAPVETAEEATIETEGDEVEETDELDDLLKQATGEETSDLADVEYEGKTYKLPAELKDALLRQSDYTKKTMSLADRVREVEETKTKVEEIFSATEEAVEASFNAKAAEARVKALLETPIDGLDQAQINALRLDLADAQSAVAHHKGRAAELATKAVNERSQHQAKAVETARAEAAKHIPNLDDAKLAALDSLVVSLGGESGTVKQLDHPAAYRVLHLAHIGQQFIERQRQAGKAAHATQPAAEVPGGKAAPAKKHLVRDADKMSQEEWLKAREAELAKR